MPKVDDYLRGLARLNEQRAELSDLDESVRMAELDKLWYSMGNTEQAEVERRLTK